MNKNVLIGIGVFTTAAVATLGLRKGIRILIEKRRQSEELEYIELVEEAE